MIKTYVKPGEYFETEMPYSEVCMHMRIAGKVMRGELLDRQYPMVQLYDVDGRKYSSPITTGEAGLYEDSEGYYYYKGEV